MSDPRVLPAHHLRSDHRRSLPQDGAYLPTAAGHVSLDQAPRPCEGRAEELAGEGCALHLRHRRRPHPWPRRSGRQRHGHPHRQAPALYGRGRACRPRRCCRCIWTPARTTRRCSAIRSIMGLREARPADRRSSMPSSTNSSTPCRRSSPIAASTSRTGPAWTPCICWSATATRSAAITTTCRARRPSCSRGSSTPSRSTARKLAQPAHPVAWRGVGGRRHGQPRSSRPWSQEGLSHVGGPGADLDVRRQRPAGADPDGPGRLSSSLTPIRTRPSGDFVEAIDEHKADRDHRRQHHRRRLHPRGRGSHVAGSTSGPSSLRCRTRPSTPNAPPSRPMGGRRARRSMRRASSFRPCPVRRAHPPARTGEQLLHLPGHRTGGLRDPGQADHRRDVHRGGKGRRRSRCPPTSSSRGCSIRSSRTFSKPKSRRRCRVARSHLRRGAGGRQTPQGRRGAGS